MTKDGDLLYPAVLLELAERVSQSARARSVKLVTAESCTGGLIAAALTAIAGSSEAVARAMAEGALRASLAQLAVSVTGVAGPGGGTLQKPVGLVHFACASRTRPTFNHVERYGDLGRGAIRLAAATTALELLLQSLN